MERGKVKVYGTYTPLPVIDEDLLDHVIDSRVIENKGAKAQYVERLLVEDRARMRALSVVHTYYPRIALLIADKWGTEQLHERLSRMLFLDTEGRNGFPIVVGKALMYIHRYHQEKFGFETISETRGMEKDTW